MATQRETTSKGLATRAEQPTTTNELLARSVPIQYSIQQLSGDLDALNERIIELEQEGHGGYVMDVLKANAMDFARRIDELRCILVESSPRDAPGGRSPKRSNRNCPGSPLVGSGSK